MFRCGSFLCYTTVAWLSFSLVTVYLALLPQPCELSVSSTKENIDKFCVTPLFEPDESVDIYLYTSERPKIDLHMPAQFATLDLVWNQSDVPLSETLNATVFVKQATDVDPSSEQSSKLYLHALVVRSGHSPDPSQHERVRDKRPMHGYHRQKWPRAEYQHLLHASAPLTRHMVPIRQPRHALLEGLTNRQNESNGSISTNFSIPSVISGAVGLPDYKIELARLPVAAWAVTAWTGMGLIAPSPTIAIIRGAVAAACVAILDPKLHTVPPETGKVTVSAPASVHKAPPVVHWRPRISLSIVDTANHAYPLVSGEAPVLSEAIVVTDSGYSVTQPTRFKIFEEWRGTDRRRMLSATGGNPDDEIVHKYQPILYFREDTRLYEWTPLGQYAATKDSSQNSPTTSATAGATPHQTSNRLGVPLRFEFHPQSLLSFQVSQMMEQSLQFYQQYGASETDVDELKSLLSLGLWKYAVVQVIGIIQVSLQMLAFKNDISFFRGRDDYSGLSASSQLSSVAMSIIIFLYLLDNEFTSRLVLYPMGIGILIDLWKIKKQLKLRLVWQHFQPWVASAATTSFSAGERATKQYDAKGVFYLKLFLAPLVLFSSLYALKHYSYKSWWSWAISSLADASYMFGFINMTPQIFINYKLKSVAHMPWRVMIYKAFHTFIDDVIAFTGIFPMPAKHRWMTLRDDVVFAIFLFQRYIYRIDYQRADEYGYVHSKGAKKAEIESKKPHGTRRPVAVWSSPPRNDSQNSLTMGQSTPKSSDPTRRDLTQMFKNEHQPKQPALARGHSLPATTAHAHADAETPTSDVARALSVPLLRRSKSAPSPERPKLQFSPKFDPTSKIRDAVFGNT